MPTLWKLTDSHGITKGNTHWSIGVTHYVTGNEHFLCTPGVIHVYEHPFLGLFVNSIHGAFISPRLWEGEGTVVVRDPLKAGVKSLTLTKELEVPKITSIHRIAFGILCTLEVEKSEAFVEWAINWLEGRNRIKRLSVDPSENQLLSCYTHGTYWSGVEDRSALQAGKVALRYKGVNFGSIAQKALSIV